MLDQSEMLQLIIDNLDAAADELRTAQAALSQARAALLHIQQLDAAQQAAELEALWEQLNDLGRPVVTMGACVIKAMQEIGAQIGATPTAPSQLDWLTGIDVRAEHTQHEREQRATALLEWLEPYLARVSARTRNIITLAIKRSASGQEPHQLIDQLTPETFKQELLRGGHRGLVASIRGLGPRGLRELREAIGIDGDERP